MNPRIQQLAEQAGSTHKQNLGVYQFYADELEKFAQLIVKECLEACSRANEIRHLVPPTQQQVVLSCMDEIERTFRS
jgi:uncharacterized coiled-coil DUF342 family protein